MTYCRKATLEDVEYLSTRLRQVDQYEVWAATGLGPRRALLESLAMSDVSRVFCTPDDEPLCIHGTVPVPWEPLAASAWLLGTDRMKKYRKDFLLHSKLECSLFHRKYRVLFNYVWEGNRVSIAWLKWIGGGFINRHPEYGYARVPFLEYIHTESTPCASPHSSQPSR